MSARDEVLSRVRRATADVQESRPEVDVPVDWTYGQPLPTADVLGDFVEKVEDYKATVTRCHEAQVGQALVTALQDLGATSVVVPGGFPDEWTGALRAAGLTLHSDEPPLTHGQLNTIDAVVSTCAVASDVPEGIARLAPAMRARRPVTWLS